MLTRLCRRSLVFPLAVVASLSAGVSVSVSGSLRADEARPLWLVVGSESLAKAVEPLAAHRRSQGLETRVAAPPVDKAIAASPRRPDFVLIVGDDAPGASEESWCVPAQQRELYRWRAVQRRRFASDLAWGDLDGDLMPDVAVGRIPARSVAEVELVVAKTIAFESRASSARDLDLNFWAGSPGYGAAIDAMATSMLLDTLARMAPKWTTRRVISADARHPLCGWPPEQAATFTAWLRRGGLCNALMGHGNVTRFFSMRHGRSNVSYSAGDIDDQLQEGEPAAPLFVFTCSSGDFAASRRCLAESFLFFPAGPVATVAATTESHPLTNFFSGQSFLQSLGGSERRLGPLWLEVQRRAQRARNLLVEPVLKNVEGKLEPEIDVAKLRRDQMLMYAILGDPATRLRVPSPLTARVERVGAAWRWSAERPAGAQRLEIGLRPPASPLAPARAVAPAADAARRDFAAASAAYVFVPQTAPVVDGPWTGTIEGEGTLRLVASGSGGLWVAAFPLAGD